MKDLARDAILVQDACNLSGVVSSFARAMEALWKLEPDLGTDARNTHPICVLWSSKIASLTGSDSMVNFSKAYDACKVLQGE